MRQLRGVWVALLVLGLAACATTGEGPPGEEGYGAGAGTGAGAADERGAQARPIGEGGAMALDPLEDPDSVLAVRTIYFDFDSAQVRDEYLAAVEAHGAYLADNPGVRIRLEGHADERGSREYNIGLGERRAQSVSRLLLLQGGAAAQVQPVSYGEERPAAFGSGEDAWAKNRRVEIVYEGR